MLHSAAKIRGEKESIVTDEKDTKAPEGETPEEDTEGNIYFPRPAVPDEGKGEGFYPQRPAVPEEDEGKGEGFYPQRP